MKYCSLFSAPRLNYLSKEKNYWPFFPEVNTCGYWWLLCKRIILKRVAYRRGIKQRGKGRKKTKDSHKLTQAGKYKLLGGRQLNTHKAVNADWGVEKRREEKSAKKGWDHLPGLELSIILVMEYLMDNSIN